MKNIPNSEEYSGPHFLLEHLRLEPGDIILEKGYEWHSEKICTNTGSRYSHVMLCVGGTIMEATHGGGVFSRIPNRSTVRDVRDFKVMRLAKHPGQEAIDVLCNYARYLAGSKYSISAALRVKGPDILRQFKENGRKQFCSRMVAQCFNRAGLSLVDDANFCSPGDIERSELLTEVPGMVRQATADEVAFAHENIPHSTHIQSSVRFVEMALAIFQSYGIKSVGTDEGDIVITILSDITTAVIENCDVPGLDEQMTNAINESGYLDYIEADRERNAYRYAPVPFKLHIECKACGSIVRLVDLLEQELKKETDLIDSRARHYLILKENLSSGLRFAEAEFSIPRGLLKAILDRTMVLEGYTALLKDIPEIRNINQKCNFILDRIKAQMPELYGS